MCRILDVGKYLYTLEKEEKQARKKQHIVHLNKLADSGKMDICGPLMEDGDIRGICIYNVATAEEAEKLANDDPMVKSGRLIVEVHPFYSAKGASLK